MKKYWILLTAVAVGAIAFSQGVIRVIGAEGRGIASNSNNRNGQFRLGVKKSMRGNEVRIEGRFEWHEITTDPAHRIAVVMVRPHQVAVNNTHNVCEFSGPAKLTRMTNSGPVTIEGRLDVRVVDRRRHDGKSEPDLIRWHFASPVGSVQFGFEGFVREGDINVFARSVTGGTTGGTTGSTTGGTTGTTTGGTTGATTGGG